MKTFLIKWLSAFLWLMIFPIAILGGAFVSFLFFGMYKTWDELLIFLWKSEIMMLVLALVVAIFYTLNNKYGNN